MYFVVFFALVMTVRGDDPPCPDVKTVDDFDFHQFAVGNYYEIGRYIEDQVEKRADCTTGTFRQLSDDVTSFDIFSVQSRHRNLVNGTMGYDHDRRQVVFTHYENGKAAYKVYANVIYSDPPDHHITYNCIYDDKLKKRNEVLWILSRTPKLEGQVKKSIEDFLKTGNVVDVNKILWDHFTDETCTAE